MHFWADLGYFLVPWGTLGGERGRHFHEVELRRVSLSVLVRFGDFWGVVLEAILDPKVSKVVKVPFRSHVKYRCLFFELPLPKVDPKTTQYECPWGPKISVFAREVLHFA